MGIYFVVENVLAVLRYVFRVLVTRISTHPHRNSFEVFVLQSSKVIVGIRDMKVRRSDLFVMFGGMVFCKIVSSVCAAFAPVNDELSLSNSVSYPIKAHVDGFGSFLFHSVVGDADGGVVIGY